MQSQSIKIATLTGATLGGRYQLLRLIKAGGMGAVYEARDIKLERPVAVKILSTELTREPGMVRRLFREARAASQIRHPNIVEYLDYDQIAEGPAYLVMELLDGGDLEQVLKQRGPLPWPTLAPWLREACRALSAAHAAGIIHRDIKPSNFVLDERRGRGIPVLKLVDFGIAKLTPMSGLRGDMEMTQGLLGTEMFMAPELFTGVAPNPRSEVYAFGVSIYRLLTGKYPRSETYEFPPPSHFCASVPPEVDALVLRCLNVHPLARFESMDAVETAIAETTADKADREVATPFPLVPVMTRRTPAPPVRSPSRGRLRALGAGLLIVGCIVTLALAWRPPRTTESPQPAPPAPATNERTADVPRQPEPRQPEPQQPEPQQPEPQQPAPQEPAPPPTDWQGAPKPSPDPEIDPDPADTHASAAPAAFSDAVARAQLGALAGQARACGKKEGLLGGKVELKVRISPEGIPTATATQRGKNLPHVQCIIALVEALRFPPSASGGSVTRRYSM